MILWLVLALTVLVPGLADACSVCFDPEEANRQAFLDMTILMSLLPLALIGGGVLWIRKRVKDSGEKF